MKELLSELTVEEKAALLAGTDFMYTNPIPRLGIPSLRMSDGPHGLRVINPDSGNDVSAANTATCFPTAVTTASGWNPENTFRMGVAMGDEANDYGIHIILGPGANIKRNPRCGRNFEYYSEDPFLASEMAIGEVMGIQSRGVGVSVKHFAMNNAENFRSMGNSVADERAIREIYLKVYERIVKKANPTTLMCAYNKINGSFCSENKWLLTDLLRTEWGYDGVVMSDWGAVRERVGSIKAGLDLEMPGDTNVCRKAILDGIRSGKLSMEEVDRLVLDILRLIEKVGSTEKGQRADYEAHHRLAGEIAEDCAVLMKNDGTLPLGTGEKILVVGDLFDKMRYQGSGSSMITPPLITTPKNAFDREKVAYEYVRGYAENKIEPDDRMIAEALEAAKKVGTVLVFAGLTDYVESEGEDRKHLSLPENQIALIDALAATGKKIVLVLFGGSVIELPFAGQVNAILNMFLPGQNGGTAAFRLLYGLANPSGRLSESWVSSYDDIPFGGVYSTAVNEIYRESYLVGYRYYETAKKPVAFPFGFGLSYTTFRTEDLSVTEEGEKLLVTCKVTNTGDRDGAEVVEVYVKAPVGGLPKPERELRAFKKVFLKAGTSQTVTLEIEKSELRYFHIGEHRFVMEDGEYEIEIGKDSHTILLSEKITLNGETVASPYSETTAAVYRAADLDGMTDAVFEEILGEKLPTPPVYRPFTTETPISEYKDGAFLGRMIYKILLAVPAYQLKQAEKMPEGKERDNKVKAALFLDTCMRTNSARTLSMSAGKSMQFNIAEGFTDFANGRFFRGLKHFLTPIKVPKLPKEEK